MIRTWNAEYIFSPLQILVTYEHCERVGLKEQRQTHSHLIARERAGLIEDDSFDIVDILNRLNRLHDVQYCALLTSWDNVP